MGLPLVPPYQVGFGAQTPDRLLLGSVDRRESTVLLDGGSDAREERTLQKMELVMAGQEGDDEYSVDQKKRNTRGAVAGTKKKTSTVRDVIDGKDIFDLRFQITSQRTQMTRSTLAKVMDEVGARQ